MGSNLLLAASILLVAAMTARETVGCLGYAVRFRKGHRKTASPFWVEMAVSEAFGGLVTIALLAFLFKGGSAGFGLTWTQSTAFCLLFLHGSAHRNWPAPLFRRWTDRFGRDIVEWMADERKIDVAQAKRAIWPGRR